MRHFLIIVPLGMLLLSSCEPDGGSSQMGTTGPRDPDGKGADGMAADSVSHARLAAQNSLGKHPQSRDLSAAVRDSCPVHHEKMNLREIPIVFVEPEAEGTESAPPPATAEFPFGAEKIISAGNALLPGEPMTARVYQCASCVAASRLADVKRRKPAVPAARE